MNAPSAQGRAGRRIGLRRPLPAWAAFLAAAAGGLLLDVASPGVAWWWAAFPAAVLVFAAVWRQSIGIGSLAGLIAGAAFWLPHISWLTLYLGPIPWLGLCAVMTLWFALFGAATAAATSALAAVAWLRTRVSALILAQSLAAAGLWVLREQVQGFWPYGGFPWGRLAHTQSDGPLLQAVSWLGFAGLSGAIAFVCALPVAAFGVRVAQTRVGDSAMLGPARWAIAGSLALVTALSLVPVAPVAGEGTLRVAAVQGNSKSAIFDDRESGDVIRDHFTATNALLDDLERSGDAVDVIVWPENSAEFDVLGNDSAMRRLSSLSARADAPIVIGAILANDGAIYTNSSLVWDAEGATGERYDKRYPVPFAEYMPHRDFYHALVPDLVDLVQLEYTPGTLPAAFDVETVGGAVRAGIAICFDIIFDQQAVAMIEDGAEVIFAQTNNADFGRTDESVQQLAIAHLRGVESGRSLVNISTVATSAIFAPDGRELASIEPHAAGAMVADTPLAQGVTPALQYGAAIAAVWMAAGAAGLVVAMISRAVRIRSRRPGRATAAPGEADDPTG